MNEQSLKSAENRLFLMCNEAKKVSKGFFVQGFPASCGIQIAREPWGLHLMAPPALPRVNNNCWAVIRQMALWERYFDVVEPDLAKRTATRYIAAITHHSKKPLSFIPNTVEAHALLNGLVHILKIDDNPATIEALSVDVVVSENDDEACEISVSSVPLTTDLIKTAKPLPSPFAGAKRHNLAREFHDISDFRALSPYQRMDLFRKTVEENAAVREQIPYASIERDYPLRRKRSSSVQAYREMFLAHPFAATDPSPDGSFCIMADVPFRSWEQIASDVFCEKLYQFLLANPAVKNRLRGKSYQFTIYRKSDVCDNDNIPFDMIHRLLLNVFSMSVSGALRIQYAPNCACETVLEFTSAAV